METAFYIRLNIKTPNGFESYGKFYLGNNEEIAKSIFSQLKGSDEVNEKSILQIDFMASRHKLPMSLRMISCTLEEMAHNCRVISKEIFKHFNMVGH